MKSTNFFLFFCLFLFSNSFAQTGCYKLVWADEFNYTGFPSPDKWGYDIGGHGWGNGESQYYTSRLENARVENGNLVIEAIKESYGGKQYTSARVISKNKGDWKYGRIEVRAKLPKGTGTWPAIWMLPTDWVYGGWPSSGEIDIMEHVGYDQGRVHGTVHTEAYNHSKGTQKGGSLTFNDVSETFHEYVIEWFEDRIDFYIDGKNYFTFYNENKTYKEWPFDQRFHLLLNIAVGGSWGGAQGIDDSIFPQQMLIDYVRVYEINDAPAIDGPDTVTPNENNLTFSVNEFPDIVYEWFLPDGVELLSKMDSSSINVNWGEIGGTVSVKMNGDLSCSTDSVSYEVYLTTKPDTSKYNLINLKDGIINEWSSVSQNTKFVELNSELLIEYNNSTLSKIAYEIPLPHNLTDHSIVKFAAKNISDKDIKLIMTFEDTDGIEMVTGAYEFTIFKDSLYRIYSEDFAQLWTLDNPSLDPVKISKLNIYLPSGQGSFYLKDINVLLNTVAPEIPQSLTFDNHLLSWTDSDFATKYDIYFSTEPSGTYTKVRGNIPTWNNPFDISGFSNGHYKLVARNSFGESGKSESLFLLITAINQEDHSLLLYPNPATDYIHIRGIADNSNISLYGVSGQCIPVKYQLAGDEMILDVRDIELGTYMLVIDGKSFYRFKVLIK